MRLRLTIRGDEAICDWTDSDEQAKGPINATFVVTAASCYSGFLNVVSDDIPINSGCYRPIRLVTRPGTLVNVKQGGRRSAATRRPTRISRTSSSGRWPGRCRSGSPPPRARLRATSCSVGSIPSTGTTTRTITSKERLGRHVDHDGNSVLCPNNGNCRNTPVEILETKYPFIVEEYRIAPDSAGAGRWRGGLASSRTFRDRAGDHRQRPLRPHADPRTRASSAARRERAAASSSSVPATTGSVASRRRLERSPIPSSRASP